MIRTKDLVLFCVTIVFLAMGISFTLAREQRQVAAPEAVTFAPVLAEDQLSAGYDARELDRQSIIARLRNAIKNSDSVISAPVAEVAADTETVEPEIETETAVALNRCPMQADALTFARSWPREGVVVQSAEGVRSVAVIGTSAPLSFVGTTTATTPAVQVRTLATLPLYPRMSDLSCIGSEIIGVTADGALMFNSDAIAYYTKGTDTLLGYARDGVPIYGVFQGETDECGGYESSTGYRYSVSPERNFIIGCYHASPTNFVGE